MTTVIKKMKTAVNVIKEIKKATEKTKHPTEIYEFVKERRMGRRQKVGVFVGLKGKGGLVGIGWSRANIKKDKFDKDRGLKIARGRANASIPEPFPASFDKKSEKFIKRCERFFKVYRANICCCCSLT